MLKRLGAICASKWHWSKDDPLKQMTLCLWKTINGNQTKKHLEKKRRFNLETQTGGHIDWKFVCSYCCWKEDRILIKAVFQIICSHSMHALQPSDSGKCNTAESCTQYDKNILKMQNRTSIITKKRFMHYHQKLCNKQHFSSIFHHLSVPVTI